MLSEIPGEGVMEMSKELTNEQRAHDFACAVISSDLLLKSQIEFAELPNDTNRIDVLKVYTRFYNGALEYFNKNSD